MNTAPPASRLRIPPTLSIVLDTFRVVLALLVAIGHWTQSYFQDGLTDLTPIAVTAVGGFFVLSGFTIRSLTIDGPARAPGRYFVDRLSRLWSVMLPALALTVVCDGLAIWFDRDYYFGHWGASATAPVWRLLVNAGFASQLWGQDISPLSNSPFWSLSYEMGFYLAYGIWLWRGWIPAAIVCVLLGPNITAMLAVWAIGVAVFEAYDRMTVRTAAWTAAACALLLALGAWQARALYDIGWAVSLELIRTGFGVIHVSRGRIHPWLLIGAVGFTVLLVLLIALARMNDQHRVVNVEPLIPFARRLGEFTFPLYLCHFPIFVALGAWGGYDRTNRLVTWGLCGLVFAAIFFLVVPATDLCKRVMRRRLMRLIDEAPATAASGRPA